MRRFIVSTGLLLLLAAVPQAAHAGAVTVTAQAGGQYAPLFATSPSIVTTLCTNVTCAYGLETFSGFTPTQASTGFTSTFSSGARSLPPGASLSGKFSGAISARATDQYGGVPGAAFYPYAAGGATFSVDVTAVGLPGINYLGIWVSALDAQNVIKVFTADGGSLSITADMITKALNGNAGYYGNSTAAFSGQDSSELFAYLNVFVPDTYFTKLQITENSGGGFEASNFAAGYFAPSAGAKIVTTQSIPVVTPVASVVVPEAGSLALLAGFAGAAVLERRRRVQ